TGTPSSWPPRSRSSSTSSTTAAPLPTPPGTSIGDTEVPTRPAPPRARSGSSDAPSRSPRTGGSAVHGGASVHLVMAGSGHQRQRGAAASQLSASGGVRRSSAESVALMAYGYGARHGRGGWPL